MAPPYASTSAAAPSNQALIEQLQDDLMIQRAFLVSFQTEEQTPSVRDQISGVRAEIKRIQTRLAEAKARNPTGPKSNGPASKTTSQKSTSVQPWASKPTSSNMYTPHSQTPAWDGSAAQESSRKRTFGSAYLDVDSLASSGNKSRRTTPSPDRSGLSLNSSPGFSDFGRNDIPIIDLTGDDEDIMAELNRQKEEEARLRRNKRQADSDAVFAQRLARGDLSSPAASSPRPSGVPNAFDRLLHRPEPEPPTFRTSSVQGASEPSAASRSQEHHHVPGAFPESTSQSSFGRQPLSPPSFPLRSVHGRGVVPSHAYTPNHTTPGLAHGAGIVRSGSRPNVPLDLTDDTNGWGTSSGNVYGATSGLPATGDLGYGLPGHLTNGRPSFSDFMPASWVLPPPVPSLASHQSNNPLASIINRTAGYDFSSLVDGQGNAFNPRLTSYMDDLVNDPRKTQEEIKELLSNIRPDMEIPEEERGSSPEALRYALFPHQQLALKWMVDMEEGSNKGGILADDMGLGKTLSTLAVMVSRPSNSKVKTNLIVGPVSLIKQWESEIQTKLKLNCQMTVCLLHGKKMQYSTLKKFDVVLTTYGTLAAEWKRYTSHVELPRDDDNYDPRNDAELQKKCPLLHPKHEWYRIVLDEAQCIKNKDTQSSKGASMLKSTYRWCLTGTPMMNGVQELFPLIRFLKIKPYNDHKTFQEAFSTLAPAAKGNHSQHNKDRAMQKLRAVLKAIMLRRMKTSEIDGKPIVQLPPKTESKELVELSEDERSFYKDLEEKSQVIMNKYLRAGTVGKNYSNILVLLLRLRQACCHPHLNMDFECVGSGEIAEDEMLALARSLEPTVVQRIKEMEDAFECPVCYDAVQDPTFVIPCGHDTCAQCFVKLTENNVQEGIRQGGDHALRCPQCRGPIDPKRVINYSAFKRVHMPESLKGEVEEDDDSDETASECDSETASEAEEDDTVEAGPSTRKFDDYFINDLDEDDDDDDDYDDDSLLGDDVKSKARSKSSTGKKPSGRRKKSSNSKSKSKKAEIKPSMLKALHKEAGKNKDARKKYMSYLKEHWKDSAKVTKVVSLLGEIKESGEKTIVFSQWTSLLDLLEVHIKSELPHTRFVRYDGSMSAKQRAEAVNDFMKNDRTTIMLCSLRAGNAGLNLVAASRIIITDPFWNPYIEMQAVDRAHRIGQQRPVQVHRVLVENTVEDRIMDMQQRKRELVESALDEGESKSLGRLDIAELAYLFGVRPQPN